MIKKFNEFNLILESSKMSYPSKEEVESADHFQICKWWRFLDSPGLRAIGTDDFDEVLKKEVEIMDLIKIKLEEYGGFTPAISKSLGWG